MLKVGITGGIGSGKTVVSQILEAMGFPVFNSDNRAKELSDNHPEIRKKLLSLFGSEVYTDTGLNRPFLASQIFNNEDLRGKVNAIIHPRVREAFDQFCERSKSPVVFNEAAILIETGSYKNFDKMILVTAPEDIRIARVMKRDHTSEEEVRQRLSKQWTDAEKRKFADFEIVNDGKEPVLKQIEQIIDHLTSSQGS